MENISSSASQFRLHHHSLWLENTLSEVDAKFKTILNMFEDDDGETFAKRAEMYYHNKPQLIELVQDLHKSYRVLVKHRDQLKCDSTRAHKSNCNSSRILQDLHTPVVESRDTKPNSSSQIANNFNIISKSLTDDDSNEVADCGTPTYDNINNLNTISISLEEDNNSKAADCGTPINNSSEAAVCGTYANDVEAIWDRMKSSVTLLRDNEYVLVTFLRKYEDQRAEIRTLKSEVMFLRRLLDVERLENKEKQSSRSIPKFKRALRRLLSARKN